MLPTASATLVTNLTNSLANANHRWVVVRVEERRWRQASTGTNLRTVAKYNVNTSTVDGNENLLEPVFVEAVETTIRLVGTKVRRTAGEAAMLGLDYLSVWLAGVFSYGECRFSDGTAYRHTTAGLDTAIRTMALALMTTRQTPLESTTSSGDASADPIAMPSDLLTALLASLANATHQWKALSANRITANGVTTFNVQLAARSELKMKVGGVTPAGLMYRAELNAAGTIIEAIVYLGGNGYRTFSTDLHTAITTLAATIVSSTTTNLTASLNAGPEL